MAMTKTDRVTTVVLSHRGERYLPGALASLRDFADVPDPIIVDDSGDSEHRRKYRALAVAAEPAGYWRAMQAIWSLAEDHEHIFLFEEDFRLIAPVDLDRMARHLEYQPRIAQFVLVRQPWFPNEHDAGGVVPALKERGCRFEDRPGWQEHQATWSTNPTVFRGSDWVRQNPWPSGSGSEWSFGNRVFAAGQVAAYWGYDVSVEHVGERTGFGY